MPRVYFTREVDDIEALYNSELSDYCALPMRFVFVFRFGFFRYFNDPASGYIPVVAWYGAMLLNEIVVDLHG